MQTAAHVAARYDRLDILKEMKRLDICLDTKDIKGRRPISYAAIHKNHRVVEFLRDHTTLEYYEVCTPLFKSNRNFFCNVKTWFLFSMYRFEICRVA